MIKIFKPTKSRPNFFTYPFKRDTLLATILVFLVIGLFARLETVLGILDPRDMTSKDFDYNDLSFNLLHRYYNIQTDTDIFIVNVGSNNKKGIVGIINKVNAVQPKVIGLDVLLDSSAVSGADTT